MISHFTLHSALPGQRLSDQLEQEILERQLTSGQALYVLTPCSMLCGNRNDYRNEPAQIIVECHMGYSFIIRFDIRLGFFTDFTNSVRRPLSYGNRGSAHIYNLHLSFSQTPVFIQHVILMGYFAQRSLRTISPKESRVRTMYGLDGLFPIDKSWRE